MAGGRLAFTSGIHHRLSRDVIVNQACQEIAATPGAKAAYIQMKFFARGEVNMREPWARGCNCCQINGRS